MASVSVDFKYCINLLCCGYILTCNSISMGRNMHRKTANAIVFVVQVSLLLSVFVMVIMEILCFE